MDVHDAPRPGGDRPRSGALRGSGVGFLSAQREWCRVYGQLATADGGSQTTALRRRLQRLSVRISTDPFWASIPGRAPVARMDLKHAARDAGEGEG